MRRREFISRIGGAAADLGRYLDHLGRPAPNLFDFTGAP